MNGKDLLKSMTAIDETYLKEAEDFMKERTGGITMKNENQDFRETSEQEQPTVTISMWKRITTAAACFLVCAGVVSGGVYALNQRRNLAEMPSAEVTETETATETTFHQPAQEVTETVIQTETSAQKKETAKVAEVKTAVIAETTVPLETMTEAVTFAETESIETITTAIAQEETEVFIQETDAPAPETEALIPETEAPPQETLSTETIPALGRESYYYVASEDKNYVPGFVVLKFVDNVNPDLYCMNKLRCITDGSEAQEVETIYKPTYIPDECALLETIESPVHRGITYHYYMDYQRGEKSREAILEEYPDVKYPNARGSSSTLLFKVTPKKLFNKNLVYGQEIPSAQLAEVNGHICYLEKMTEDAGTPDEAIRHEIIWDNGDYVMTVSGYFPLEELLKVAESVQPVE